MDVTRKQSTPNFPENEHFLPRDMHTCVRVCKFSKKRLQHGCGYQGVRNVRFSENLACFNLFSPPFEIRIFALLPRNLANTPNM